MSYSQGTWLFSRDHSIIVVQKIDIFFSLLEQILLNMIILCKSYVYFGSFAVNTAT